MTIIETDLPDTDNTISALTLAGVIKRYRGFTLGPIDLDLQPGVVAGLIGPNGAGKTTTINTIIGLIRHDAGTIKVFDAVTNLNAPGWKYNVGYVGDTHVFYEYWSCERNLKFLSEFYPNWDQGRVRELADRFKLDLKKRANTLSKGNRAKLALIGALAHSPRLLLLDEPTSGLDPIVRTEFLDVLWEMSVDSETSVLYSTHILSDIARIADELIFINDGKITSRKLKEDLTDQWRRISFELDGDLPDISGVTSHKRIKNSHLVETSKFESTVELIKKAGGKDIEVSLMSIDEIAIQIMREPGDVENH